MTILLISGSLRAGSVNAAVLATVAQVAPPGIRTVTYRGLGALPHFNPDDDRPPLPAPVADLRGAIAAAGALLLCTPEYAGALPGAFKNLLDWTVGGTEMTGKAVAWINTAAPSSPTGGQGAHSSLRTVLGYVNAPIVGDACADLPVPRTALGADGLIHDTGIRRQLGQIVVALWRAVESRV